MCWENWIEASVGNGEDPGGYLSPHAMAFYGPRPASAPILSPHMLGSRARLPVGEGPKEGGLAKGGLLLAAVAVGTKLLGLW